MNSTIEIIKSHIQRIEESKKELESLFHSGVKELLQKYDIQQISMSINNHDYNDGDSTYFALNYEWMKVTFKNSDTYEGECRKNASNYPGIYKEIVDFFRIFDNNHFYEQIFGEKHERLTIYGSDL